MICNFCYLESEYLAEILFSTGVPNLLEALVCVRALGFPEQPQGQLSRPSGLYLRA